MLLILQISFRKVDSDLDLGFQQKSEMRNQRLCVFAHVAPVLESRTELRNTGCAALPHAANPRAVFLMSPCNNIPILLVCITYR